MTRFIKMPFSKKPDHNGWYLLTDNVTNRDGEYHPMQYTTEGGWNTFIMSNGEVFSESAIPDEEVAYKYWMKPVTIGNYRWADAMSDLADEIKAKMYDFADCDLTEDEEDELYKLEVMFDHISEAMDIAMGFKE